MQKVAIVTDSSSCLSPQLAGQHGIEIVPIELVLDGQVYKDGVDDPGDFYRRLREARTRPTTAAPSPGLFMEAFARAKTRGESVLCITLPQGLSSTYNSSRQAVALAQEEFPGLRIISVPAGAVAAGQGLLALGAAQAAAQGQGLDEVAALVAQLGPQIHFFAFLDTLEYLARGGRVPRAAAWMGDKVGFKPILTSINGEVQRLTQARSKEGALRRMLGLMEARNPTRAPIHAVVMHADAPHDAARLEGEIRARFPCDSLLVTQFTPVMGAHSGPGVVGVAFRCLS